jgi:asparagine synthase (glutamine-hydrolysing)
VTLARAKLASSFPDLMLASEGPVYDTSSGALMRPAEAVHEQGYKVALTGEGADGALPESSRPERLERAPEAPQSPSPSGG